MVLTCPQTCCKHVFKHSANMFLKRRGIVKDIQYVGAAATYGSSGPGRGKKWTNVTFFLKVKGCYGQRKAKNYTLSSPTILS